MDDSTALIQRASRFSFIVLLFITIISSNVQAEIASSSDSVSPIAGVNQSLANAMNSANNDGVIAGQTKAVSDILIVTQNIPTEEQSNVVEEEISDAQSEALETQQDENEQQEKGEYKEAVTIETQYQNTQSRAWPTTDAEWDLLYAIVRQEAGNSENSAWAVIQSAYNRTQDSVWSSLYGTTVLGQLCAPGQYTYSIDGLYAQYLNGNYTDAIIRGVQHCVNGETIHNYTCFRTAGYANGLTIGGNTYFRAIC